MSRRTICSTAPQSESKPLLPSGRFTAGRHMVYTVIAGDYDSLKKPLWRPQNVDYLAFVSGPRGATARGWRLSALPDNISNPKLLNRKMKILGFSPEEQYDSVTYIDGSIQIIGSLEDTITRFLESGGALGLFRHEERNNPWDELIACNELGYLSEDESRIEEARLRPFEENGIKLGLFDAGVIIKNPRQKALSEISNKWFELFLENPVRDQLSLPLVVWEYEHKVFQLEHWRTSRSLTFLRYPHRVAGYIIRSIFWLGSACPRLFQMGVVAVRHHRGKLSEPITFR